MSRKKAGAGSYVEIFWEFLRDNPELATMIAFELGSLAGAVVRNSGGKKYLKNGVEKGAAGAERRDAAGLGKRPDVFACAQTATEQKAGHQAPRAT